MMSQRPLMRRLAPMETPLAHGVRFRMPVPLREGPVDSLQEGCWDRPRVTFHSWVISATCCDSPCSAFHRTRHLAPCPLTAESAQATLSSRSLCGGTGQVPNQAWPRCLWLAPDPRVDASAPPFPQPPAASRACFARRIQTLFLTTLRPCMDSRSCLSWCVHASSTFVHCLPFWSARPHSFGASFREAICRAKPNPSFG